MRLDFKHLLVDAFEKGKLVAVVPFVAKVLDSTMNSRIFRPPNPWTMMILGLLAELHPMTDLKLNIKFEVEVLCKNLNQELKDVKAATVFKDRPVNKEGNSDWTSRNAAGASLGALKPIPSVPDERLMAAAAGLMGAPWAPWKPTYVMEANKCPEAFWAPGGCIQGTKNHDS